MEKKTIYTDMDGVIADFVQGYKELFHRNAYEDDQFTIEQLCRTEPHFFRLLPVNPQGYELFLSLKDSYNIVFLTTPMKNMEYCRIDKVEWVRENLGDYDVLFSDNKAAYVEDNTSILIDDMPYNLDPWRDAGGTAIRFPQKNEKILHTIEETFNPSEPKGIKKQLKSIIVDSDPSEKQKETGLYKHGKVNLNGLNIRIENTPGSIRSGIGIDNMKWIVKMHDYYGYIQGSTGNDGDEVDCFINPEGVNRSLVFVINQMSGNMFDEVKCMIGYDNEEEAKKAYLRNYKKGQEENIQSIVRTNTKKLRTWIQSGNYTEPYV